MPAAERRVTREDILPMDVYARERRARRAALLPMKKLRRVELGPYCTFYFENFETMLAQIHEMLLVEKGGEGQIADELAAYNPLIPAGDELVATIMFEIDEPRRREAALARLGGVEEHFFLDVGAKRVRGAPEGDVERTREDGKASSVHFVRFPLAPTEVAAFKAGAPAMIGCDHEHYAHLAALGADARAELARDLG